MKNYKYHAFLAHEWGIASRGHKIHELVVATKDEFEKRGINTWIAENCINICAIKEMLRGLHSSRNVVVFPTRRYVERIVDTENDMAKQFRYGMNFLREDIIVVIMEEALRNSRTWFGVVAESKLEEAKQQKLRNSKLKGRKIRFERIS